MVCEPDNSSDIYLAMVVQFLLFFQQPVEPGKGGLEYIYLHTLPILAGGYVWLVPGGCCLPQDDTHRDERQEELSVMRERYKSFIHTEGLLPMVWFRRFLFVYSSAFLLVGVSNNISIALLLNNGLL